MVNTPFVLIGRLRTIWCGKSVKSGAGNSPPIAWSDHHKSHHCWDIPVLVYLLPENWLARETSLQKFQNVKQIKCEMHQEQDKL